MLAFGALSRCVSCGRPAAASASAAAVWQLRTPHRLDEASDNHYQQSRSILPQTQASRTAAGNSRSISNNATPPDTAAAVPQQQQQQQQEELPSLLNLVSNYGARLTTAAQMVWAQVLQPGDTAVDATCGKGKDTLFMAQIVGPRGSVYGIDLQAAAVEATRATLHSSLAPDQLPNIKLVQGCHSQLQQLVGSNVAKLVAFNLGYLPGGDKSVITQAGSTLQAVEAALEVVCPGGLISILCYIGHPGGQEEYEQVRELVAGLSPNYWTSSEVKLINRPMAPIMLLIWRRPDLQAEQQSGTPVAVKTAA